LRTQEDVNERCLLKRSKTRQEKIDGKLTQDSRKKPRFENHHKQERKCVEDKKSRGFGWKKTNSKDTTRENCCSQGKSRMCYCSLNSRKKNLQEKIILEPEGPRRTKD